VCFRFSLQQLANVADAVQRIVERVVKLRERAQYDEITARSGEHLVEHRNPHGDLAAKILENAKMVGVFQSTPPSVFAELGIPQTRSTISRAERAGSTAGSATGATRIRSSRRSSVCRSSSGAVAGAGVWENSRRAEELRAEVIDPGIVPVFSRVDLR
jgi:hypothetical protein